MMQHLPAICIGLPLLAGFITVLLRGRSEKIRIWFVVLALATELLLIGSLYLDTLAEGMRTYEIGASLPSLISSADVPFRIILVVDEISALISLVAISIIFIAGVYAQRFMREHKNLDKFYALISILAAGMVGLCFTGDLFTLFVFLEVVSISSAGLIAFLKRGASSEAAFKYLVLSSVGTLFLLLGIGMLYSQHGVLNMAAIARGVSESLSFLDKAALGLVVSTILLKSSSIPVHMWKADAFQEMSMPVVLIFMASSSVNLYVLLRIGFSVFPSMAYTIGWLIALLGGLSIFVGATMALVQTNLKRMIGYVAIAEIGYIALGAGVGLAGMPQPDAFSLSALSGALFHMMNDVLGIGLLSLTVGIALYYTKKEELEDLKGLGHSLPLVTGLFLIAVLAISGIPPLNGFASKLMIYESVFHLNPLLAVVGILGSILMLAALIRIFNGIFLGEPYEGVRREIPLSMMVMAFVLALFIVLWGLFPQAVVERLVHPAISALVNSQGYIGGII